MAHGCNMNFNFIKTYKIIILSLVLCSCATKYEMYKSKEVDGVKTETRISINSKREFKSFMAQYNSKTGDFKLIADDVSTSVSPLEGAGVFLLNKALDKVELK